LVDFGLKNSGIEDFGFDSQSQCKDLEGAHVKTIGWEGAVSVKKCIVYSVGLYKKKETGKKEQSVFSKEKVKSFCLSGCNTMSLCRPGIKND